MVAGWGNCPEVFADFNTKKKISLVFEKKVYSKRYLCIQKLCSGTNDIVATRKLPLFIKFFVIGKIAFGNDAKDLSTLNDYGTVVETVGIEECDAYGGNSIDLSGYFQYG